MSEKIMSDKAKTITVEITVITDKSIDDIKAGIKRGIYRGLDTAPYNVAQPANVQISFIE